MTKIKPQKKELQEKVISLLVQKLGKKNKDVKPMQFAAYLEAKEIVEAIEKQTGATTESILKIIKEHVDLSEGVAIKNFPKKFEVEMKKPEWYEAPTKAPDEVSIKGPVEVKQDVTGISAVAATFLGALVDFFTKLSNKIFKVTITDEHYAIPQKMVLLDHITLKPVDLKEVFQSKVIMGGGSSGGNSAALVESNTDTLDQYKISDADETGATKYYGYLDKNGNWYILKNDTVANNYRYAKGNSAFSTAWTNRATQTYDYFNVIF